MPGAKLPLASRQGRAGGEGERQAHQRDAVKLSFIHRSKSLHNVPIKWGRALHMLHVEGVLLRLSGASSYRFVLFRGEIWLVERVNRKTEA